MRAIAVRGPGQQGALSLMEVPVPEVADHEVLVRVRAFGVGLHDRWFMPPNVAFPHVIGSEAAGVVKEVGSGVTAWRAGDRVMLSNGMQAKGGTWAEFTVVPAAALIMLPEGLEFVEAAALPVAGGTALESIRSLGLERGDVAFIAGASGAIGTLVVQLARQRGWRVAASASAENHDYLRSLGAEVAFDYQDPDWADQLLKWLPSGVDAALAIQPGTGITSLPVVKDGGRLVTVSGDQLKGERGVTVEQISHHPETRLELAELAASVAAGSIRVVLERVYPFDEAVAALEKTETRHARGKVVVRV